MSSSGLPTPTADVTVEILRRIHDGDRGAWGDLYRRYHDELLFAVRSRLGVGLRAHLESEDILQSVLLEALGELDRFEPQRAGSLRHFLHVLVTNKIRDRFDHFDAAKRRGTVSLTDSVLGRVPGFDGEPRYHDAGRYERLERAMSGLPDEMREVVLLRRIEGLSGESTAARMNLSHDAVRKVYSRAMARLAARLAEEPSP